MSDDELVPCPEFNRAQIESLVGTKIKNLNLYIRAFTHKSALKKYQLTDDYETLEFMGDSVLGFVITKYLFDRYSDKKEGFLTRARTKIVRSQTLADFARKLNLGSLILMDDKGTRNNWNNNPKILEDCFEAFVGAIYLDLGMVHARDFILNILNTHDISLEDDNYKDQVMRYCQALKQKLPEYTVVSHENGIFCVQLMMNDIVYGCGYAKTKKEAEQNAAFITLKTLNLKIPKHASSGAETPRTAVRGPKV
jgi:ribonuclease III